MDITTNNAKKTAPYRSGIYNEFILWTAMPQEERIRLGIEWQYQFAEYYNVEQSTLSRWKERSDFEQRVDAILKVWSTDMTPAVVRSIYRTAIKGNPMSQMLWLQYFKKWNPKQEVEHTVKVEYGVNDVRFLISTLPEPYKTKHYGYIRELIEDAQQLRDAGRLESVTATIVEPTGAVPGEADNDAQDLSSDGSDVVAESDTPSVRTDMGDQTNGSTPTPESDHQSA